MTDKYEIRIKFTALPVLAQPIVALVIKYVIDLLNMTGSTMKVRYRKNGGEWKKVKP